MAMLVYLRRPENSPEKKLSRPKKVISQQVLCIDSIGWLDVGIKKHQQLQTFSSRRLRLKNLA